MTRTVLVTGGTGFIGAHLIEALLRRGDAVVASVRSASSRARLPAGEYRVVDADLASPDGWARTIDEVDTVFHLAGQVAGTADELHRTNGLGAAAVAAACRRAARPPRLILVSSLAAAGPSTRETLRGPADPPAPVSLYGKSKLAGEQAVFEASASVPTTIVRPGVVFGPRDRELIQLFAAIRRGRCNPLAGRHDPPVAMIHVADLVALLIAAAERGKTISGPAPPGDGGAGIYHAADPEAISFGRLGRIVRAPLGRPFAPNLPIPLTVVRAAAAAAEAAGRLRGRRGTFNRDKIREASCVSWATDVSKTVDELGWRPAASLADRLVETSRAWLAETQTNPPA